MKLHPNAYVDFYVYDEGVDLIGVAQASLPAINFKTVSITGAGVGGTVDTPLAGMIDPMELTMNFRSVTGAATKLMRPGKHQVELRAVEQHWNTTSVEQELVGTRHVMVIMPKTLNPGTVAPASAADVSGAYSVYYYAAYQEDEKLWEIDPFNQKFEIAGVDYGAALRAKLGK